MSDKPKILILSSNLLSDRTLLFTDFIPTLEKSFDVKVWSLSADKPGMKDLWKKNRTDVELYPKLLPFKDFPYNMLRRVNEFVWDEIYKPACRISHGKIRRSKYQSSLVKFLQNSLGRFLITFRMEEGFEKWLNKKLFKQRRSPEAEQRLVTYKPDIVFSMGYFWYEDPAVLPLFIEKKIPVIAYTTCWDNPFTNSRFLYDYCAYIIWNEQMKKHLNWFYPRTKKVQNYITGAPQFDVLYNPDYRTSREDFCAQYGLDPSLPIILYATGSPNMWDETDAIIYLAKKVKEGYFGKVNYMVRPHPLFDFGVLREKLQGYNDIAILQEPSVIVNNVNLLNQNEEAIKNWANTFYHLDVLVNISSTAVIDAALHDKCVVNLDFDPNPSKPNQQYIKDINHHWEHFKPVAESGGVWLVNNFEEMVTAIKAYLDDPALHSEQRKAIAQFVSNNPDGKSGYRLAKVVEEIYAGLDKSRN